MDKKILILFVRRGYLEIEYILPILKVLKKKYLIATYFEKQKAYDSLITQKKIFHDWQEVSAKYYINGLLDNLILRLILKIFLFLKIDKIFFFKKVVNHIHSLDEVCKKLNIDRKNVKSLMSDYNTHSQTLYQILISKRKPSVYFFPTSPQIIKARSKVNRNVRPFLKYVDYLFINSKYEFKYWSNFIEKKKIKIIGLPIFYELKKKNNFYKKKPKILISYNCVEKKYQKKEIQNIKFLLEQLLIFKIDIVIKLHPMKKDQYILDIVKKLNSNKIFFSSKNLKELLSDNVKVHICSTKTAAITYSNFYKIPTLGFIQYDRGYDPKSFQIQNNLVKPIKNFNHFKKDISLILKGDKTISNQQKISFNKVYMMPLNIKKNILNLFND
jgi:hypothetical protein